MDAKEAILLKQRLEERKQLLHQRLEPVINGAKTVKAGYEEVNNLKSAYSQFMSLVELMSTKD